MVLWADGPGTEEVVESRAYTGMWDFGTMTFNGTWINYPDGGSGTVEMWLAGVSAKSPSEGIEKGQNPSFIVDGQDLVEAISGMDARGAICYEDTLGHIWDLDMAYEHIFYGTCEGNPAYGFIFGDEAFYWCNDIGAHSFVYTGMWKWDAEMTIFDGTRVNYPMGTSGAVELWHCEEPPPEPEIEYYAVIAGEGYTCAYADNDAYDMYKAFTSYPNWDPANVKLLVSNAAGTKRQLPTTKAVGLPAQEGQRKS